MSSTNTVLPQLQALLDEAPAGSNPYAWWAQVLYREAYPGLAAWSKPLFWIVAVVAFLNIPVTIFTFIVKARSENGVPFYKLREHGSGKRYICLNATNIFLAGHIFTCAVFTTFPMLHLYRYDVPGRAWEDLCWAAFMWLVPYLTLLFTSIGVLYAILVAPSPFAFARRANADGQLTPHLPPLAWLPTWLLNGFIFFSPIAVTVAVLIPGIRLIQACKAMELFGIGVFETIAVFAEEYQKGITPAVADQAAFLQSLVKAKAYTAESVARWSPLYGVWLVFVAIASILAVIAFFAVRGVTKTRLILAQRSLSHGSHDSGTFELDDSRDWEMKRNLNTDARQAAIVKQARREHHSLSIQFGAAAILLLICDAMLFVDTIVGYDVHAKPDLLATCLLIPPIAYLVHSSISTALTLVRTLQGKTAAQAAAAAVRSESPVRSTHTRMESEQSYLDKKFTFGSGLPSKGGHAGTVVVNALDKQPFPVSPSMVHQIQIDQVIETEADTASVADFDVSTGAPSLNNKSRSELLAESTPTTPDLGVGDRTSFYGRAV